MPERSPIALNYNTARDIRQPFSATWRRDSENVEQPHLPPLSDMIIGGRVPASVSRSPDSASATAFSPTQYRRTLGSLPGMSSSIVPALVHEPSAGSINSSSSGFSQVRTPSDASLPIHALLSSQTTTPQQFDSQASQLWTGHPLNPEEKFPIPHVGQPTVPSRLPPGSSEAHGSPHIFR
jgi:hypothetical protein